MHTRPLNAAQALYLGMEAFHHQDYRCQLIRTSPRGNETLEWPTVWVTEYQNPANRVITCPIRDANPFLHFFEALWVLAGRNDVAFLTQFAKRFQEFTDDGETFHGAYGRRLTGKLHSIIRMIRNEPDTRRAVCSIWDDNIDLETVSKDIPCNDMLMFRVRNGRLCLTVCNRSNDMVLGAYGANVVQFSTILEYVAAKVGLPMGTYTQVSNSMHIYTSERYLKKYLEDPAAVAGSALEASSQYTGGRVSALSMDCNDPNWDEDLATFFDWWDKDFRPYDTNPPASWNTQWFHRVVQPMWMFFSSFKNHGASIGLAQEAIHLIGASDWALAVHNWLMNRVGPKA